MIGKLYQKFDDGMMYLANKAVGAWNWTTGKGKASLANKLNNIGFVSAIGGATVCSPIDAIMISPFVSIATLFLRDTNKKIEDKESRAANNGTLDAEVEASKASYETLSVMQLLIGTTYTTKDIIEYYSRYAKDPLNAVGQLVFDIIFFTSMAQGYVMRTDYIPPRKDCVRRGIDWARKKVSELSDRVRTREPVPAPVGSMDYFAYFSELGYRRGK